MSAHRVAKDLHKAADLQILLVDDPGDAGTITIDRNPAYVELVSGSGAETRILADPAGGGIQCTITMKTDGGGTITVTASSALNQAGNTNMPFADVNDSMQLYSITDGADTFAWRVGANDTLSLS